MQGIWCRGGLMLRFFLFFLVFGADVAGFFLELALDVLPDFVAGVADGFEEAAGVFGDGFEVADEGGAVGIGVEEFLQAGILAYFAGTVGEEIGKDSLKLFGFEVVEVDVGGHTHFAISGDSSC